MKKTRDVALTTVFVGLALLFCPKSFAENELADFMIYEVSSSLNMGQPSEVSYKDYYINMGAQHGVRVGSKLKVVRKMPSYDLQNRKLHKDVTFPIAYLKVIYSDENTAIARLSELLPEDKTPLFYPRAVIVGDLVEIAK